MNNIRFELAMGWRREVVNINKVYIKYMLCCDYWAYNIRPTLKNIWGEGKGIDLAQMWEFDIVPIYISNNILFAENGRYIK